MDAVLTKPVEPTHLLAAIDETYARVAMPPAPCRIGPPVVTPITAHPRFLPRYRRGGRRGDDRGARLLGGGSDFLFEVVETFRTDGRAAARASAACDRRRRSARLQELTAFAAQRRRQCRRGAALPDAHRLRDVTGKDLRQNGAGYFEKLQTEFAKLETTLGRMIRETRMGRTRYRTSDGRPI